MVLNKGFGDRFKVRFEPRAPLSKSEVHAGPQAPAAGDDQPAFQRRQVLARRRRGRDQHRGEPGQPAHRHPRSRFGHPEAFRARIFGRFNQADSTTSRQKGGTGLGLAICKRLIEMMQGRIGFEDRSGGGTTFWFELPRQAA